MYSTRVLPLLVLVVSSVRSFSFDIIVSGATQLEFQDNGTLTHTEVIPSAHNIHSVTYDPVHQRLLFADVDFPTMSIFSFDISTRKIQTLVTKSINYYYVRLVYEVVTQVLYWTEGPEIYSFSLDPASPSKAVDGNRLVTFDNYCYDLAVDSCGGYIYWITDYEIERARLDGSEREVLIDSSVSARLSLAIDQQTQKIYWTEQTHSKQMLIESANFNGKNRKTLYIVRDALAVSSLAVSKDFIYWQNYGQEGIWQLPKKPTQQVARKLYSMFSSGCAYCHRIAANYTIKDQIQGIKSCHALQGLIPYDSSVSAASICQNYCIQGECSVSAEEQPTCSCMTGYSGQRCEVKSCNNSCSNNGVCSLNDENEPVCKCTADYEGESCDVAVTQTGDRADNTTQQVLRDLHSEVRCDASNSGEGKVSACHQFCLNNGVCSLNEASEPVCQCTADFEGDRCDVPAFVVKWFLYAFKNVPLDTLREAVKSICASTVV